MHEPWIALFVTTGWLFWLAVAIFLVLEIGVLSLDDGPIEFGIAAFVVFVAGLLLFSDVFAGVTWFDLVLAAVGYVIAGVLWSIWKWYSYVVDWYREKRAAYDAQADKGGKTFQQFIEKYNYTKPEASREKSRIIGLMTLWPFSFSWWVLAWPRKLFRWLYERLSTVYDRITKYVTQIAFRA